MEEHRPDKKFPLLRSLALEIEEGVEGYNAITWTEERLRQGDDAAWIKEIQRLKDSEDQAAWHFGVYVLGIRLRMAGEVTPWIELSWELYDAAGPKDQQRIVSKWWFVSLAEKKVLEAYDNCENDGTKAEFLLLIMKRKFAGGLDRLASYIQTSKDAEGLGLVFRNVRVSDAGADKLGLLAKQYLSDTRKVGISTRVCDAAFNFLVENMPVPKELKQSTDYYRHLDTDGRDDLIMQLELWLREHYGNPG
jgi:hypothetical protein